MRKIALAVIFLAFLFACNPYKYKGQQTWLPQNQKGKKGGQHRTHPH